VNQFSGEENTQSQPRGEINCGTERISAHHLEQFPLETSKDLSKFKICPVRRYGSIHKRIAAWKCKFLYAGRLLPCSSPKLNPITPPNKAGGGAESSINKPIHQSIYQDGYHLKKVGEVSEWEVFP
jgi:hypothetical protein